MADYPCRRGTRPPPAHRPCRTRSRVALQPVCGSRAARAVRNSRLNALLRFPLDQMPLELCRRFRLGTQTGLVPLRFPIAISGVRADLQIGFSGGIALQLRSEPLKPFKSFL